MSTKIIASVISKEQLDLELTKLNANYWAIDRKSHQISPTDKLVLMVEAPTMWFHKRGHTVDKRLSRYPIYIRDWILHYINAYPFLANINFNVESIYISVDEDGNEEINHVSLTYTTSSKSNTSVKDPKYTFNISVKGSNRSNRLMDIKPTTITVTDFTGSIMFEKWKQNVLPNGYKTWVNVYDVQPKGIAIDEYYCPDSVGDARIRIRDMIAHYTSMSVEDVRKRWFNHVLPDTSISNNEAIFDQAKIISDIIDFFGREVYSINQIDKFIQSICDRELELGITTLIKQ